jgi:hypothetical protein
MPGIFIMYRSIFSLRRMPIAAGKSLILRNPSGMERCGRLRA